MSKFCSNCGKEIADGMAFCQECGAKVDIPAENKPEPKAEVDVQPAPVYVPVSNNQQTPSEEEKFKTVKVSTYFWLNLVFAIPVIGLIINLIVAFAPKNKNIKNFAKSKLVWLLIAIIIFIIGFIITLVAGGSVLEQLSISSIGDLIQSLFGGTLFN